MEYVNEGSELTVEAVPLNSSRLPVIPTAMRYRIDCLTNNRTVLDYTSIAEPAELNLIIVTGALNAIVNNSNAREIKQMTVETTSGTSVRNDTIDWEVKNIYGVR